MEWEDSPEAAEMREQMEKEAYEEDQTTHRIEYDRETGAMIYVRENPTAVWCPWCGHRITIINPEASNTTDKQRDT